MEWINPFTFYLKREDSQETELWTYHGIEGNYSSEIRKQASLFCHYLSIVKTKFEATKPLISLPFPWGQLSRRLYTNR